MDPLKRFFKVFVSIFLEIWPASAILPIIRAFTVAVIATLVIHGFDFLINTFNDPSSWFLRAFKFIKNISFLGTFIAVSIKELKDIFVTE